VPPTEVTGEKTDLPFTISSALCQHSDCFSCVTAEEGEYGCGFCTADPSRSVCVELTAVGTAGACVDPDGGNLLFATFNDNAEATETCSLCAAPSLEITAPLNLHTLTVTGGTFETTITWVS